MFNELTDVPTVIRFSEVKEKPLTTYCFFETLLSDLTFEAAAVSFEVFLWVVVAIELILDKNTKK